MKTRTLLIAAIMLVALSAAAFGQAIYSVSSTPVTTVISTGMAELTGSITFTNTNAGAASPGTISIQYSGGISITSNFLLANPSPVTITTAPAGQVTVDQTASVYTPGLLVLDVTAGYAGNITVNGVRVQINGQGLTNVTATISATGNLIQAGNTVVTVINGVAAGLTSVASYDIGQQLIASKYAGTAVAASATGTITAGVTNGSATTTTIAIKEGFLNAFVKGVGVRVQVTAVPPKGVTFTFPGAVNSYDVTGTAYVVNPNWVTGDSAGNLSGAPVTINGGSTAAGALNVYYYVGTDTTVGTTAESVNVETLEIPVGLNVVAPTTSYTPATFTYTVSLAPILAAYNSSNIPGSLAAPRFADSELGPANLLTIAPSSTVLLMPYVSSGGGFDTGIAIANTTEDPGATLLGLNYGAVPQSGGITFYFFSQNNAAAMFSYATSSTSPGSGLVTGTGNVQSGGTYVVLLSQLLTAAGQSSTTWAGYIIAVTNFTNAHGLYTVSNFTTLAAYSSLMQVLYGRQVAPESIIF